MVPLPGWAVIRPEEKTKIGMIEIPDSAKTDMQQGEVIEIDPTYFKDGVTLTVDVKKGDRVIFKKYYDNDIEVDGDKYKVVQVENIMIKLNK